MSLITSKKSVWTAIETAGQDQRGSLVIVAMFAVVGLSVLGLIAAQMLAVGSRDQIRSWESEQALYAAESAVDWAAQQINQQGTCGVTATDRSLATGTSTPAWFDVTGSQVTISERPVCRITATGKAGGSAAAPGAQRTLDVLYRAVVID